METSIKLDFPYTFLDRVLAEFVLIPDSKLKIFIHSLIPLIGVAVFVFALWRNIPMKVEVGLISLAMFFFTPVLIVFGVAISYMTNKAIREPFTYLFDEKGIHVSATTYEYTHRWAAITRVKITGHHLLFFLAPGSAHCIPMSAVRRAGVLDALLELARSKVVEPGV